MEINQAWIDQQRAVCEVANDVYQHPQKVSSQRSIVYTLFPSALDALEASMQREAEKDAEIVRMTAERDAAVSDMLVLVKSHCVCDVCKHGRDNGEDRVPCEYEKWCSQQLWEWRGPCALQCDENGV